MHVSRSRTCVNLRSHVDVTPMTCPFELAGMSFLRAAGEKTQFQIGGQRRCIVRLKTLEKEDGPMTS